MIWPVFCSALIVGRLAPLGLHNTRFRSVPLSCSPRTGADASSPRHETRRNVADSGSLGSRKGLRRRTSPVLYAPSAFSAMALPYGSPAVPAGGGMPHSPAPVAYTRPMRRAPWPERCAGPSAPPCEAAHDTACSGARGTGPLVSMAAAHARPAIPRASTSAANVVQPKRPRPAPPHRLHSASALDLLRMRLTRLIDLRQRTLTMGLCISQRLRIVITPRDHPTGDTTGQRDHAHASNQRH